MKITCDSCQSKYTVSDEKVQGKTVKIKCKKCGATILVGAGGATTSSAGGAVGDAGSSNAGAADGITYLVNVAEGDQRTMTIGDVVSAYNSSVINAETYVWTDGMGDWLPLGQVDVIVAALNSEAPAAAPAPEPEPAPRAAAVRREPGRRSPDLFGGGFGGAAGATEEVATSASSFSGGVPQGAVAAKPAGAREENSVLFSLSALTAKAGTPSSSGATATTAQREDSGLIDLKALAASAPAASSSHGMDNLMGDAGGLFPLGMPAVTAPAAGAGSMSIPPGPAKSKTGLIIGLGAGFAVLCIVGAFVAMQKGGDKPITPVESAAAPVQSVAPPPAPTEAPTAEASAAPSASASAVAVGPKGGRGPGKANTAPKVADKSNTSASPPPPAGGKKGNCGCASGDLMCAMKCSAGGK